MSTSAELPTPSLRLEAQWDVARDFLLKEIVRMSYNHADPAQLRQLIRRRRDLPVEEQAVRACIDEFRHPHRDAVAASVHEKLHKLGAGQASEVTLDETEAEYLGLGDHLDNAIAFEDIGKTIPPPPESPGPNERSSLAFEIWAEITDLVFKNHFDLARKMVPELDHAGGASAAKIRTFFDQQLLQALRDSDDEWLQDLRDEMDGGMSR